MTEKLPFRYEDYRDRHRTCKIAGRIVDYAIHHQPDIPPTNRYTALLVPGFGCRTWVFGRLSHELNNHGFQTVVMAPHRVDDTLPQAIRESAHALLNGELGLETGHLTIAGHSLGGHDAVVALAEDDDLARALHRLILVAPAGFGGEVKWRRSLGLIMNELGPWKKSNRSPEMRKFMEDVVRYSLSAGPSGILNRINVVKNDPVIERAADLRARGLDMLGVLYANDHLINLEDACKGMEEARVPYEVITGLKGETDHSGFLYRPDVLVDVALRAIEQQTLEAGANA